jgi:hypothetical protein
MNNQNLFEALQNVCGFTALESDMFEIINAYDKDKSEQLMPSVNGSLPYPIEIWDGIKVDVTFKRGRLVIQKLTK